LRARQGRKARTVEGRNSAENFLHALASPHGRVAMGASRSASMRQKESDSTELRMPQEAQR
jgi:hypothetical protein